MIVVEVDNTNVSFDEVSYPKMFYAKAIHNNIIEIRNQNTDKLFQKEVFNYIKVDGSYLTTSIATVNALNAILTPTLA